MSEHSKRMSDLFDALNPAQKKLVPIIRSMRASYPSLEAAAKDQLEFLVSQDVDEDRAALNIDAAVQFLRAEFEGMLEIGRIHTLHRERELWYLGPKVTDLHWPAFRNFLLNHKGWSITTVEDVDTSSNEVVSFIGNPDKDAFDERGLALGYVQSGKTANMTAVIAKAVDAGYNMVIVLGGITNKLRSQTQKRIEADVVERHRDKWFLHTEIGDNGDFYPPANRQFSALADIVQLIVIKKEVTRLSYLYDTLRNTPAFVRRMFKVLLIDDECDQASPNTSAENPSPTNAWIRKILALFEAVTYVGYTATPFANVFIDPAASGDDGCDADLYPSSFITSLPRPEGYFGVREVFGWRETDTSEVSDNDGMNLVRLIEKEELPRLLPRNRDDAVVFHPEITESLSDALIWFLLSSAERLRRGHNDSHMTMLIHTSNRVAQHDFMAEAVNDWLGENSANIISGSAEIWQRLEEVWRVETNAYVSHIELPSIAFELHDEVCEVLSRLEVVTENSPAEQRVDYDGEAKIYIVIGGAILSRGLTLEGLTVSFFLRNANQYDTLLQMGRWFGFRPGYEDLPRLWSTKGLLEKFRTLGQIEEEVRAEIKKYAAYGGITPLDFAVSVRKIPGMAITSANKMRAASRVSISYSGRQVETVKFERRNFEWLKANWDAASTLIKDIEGAGIEQTKTHLFEDVPAELIRKFLAKYSISDQHFDLKKRALYDYVDALAEKYDWNVYVVTTNSDRRSEWELGSLGKVGTVNRSRLVTRGRGVNNEDIADLKSILTRKDVAVDADLKGKKPDELDWDQIKQGRPEKPLLLLYPIRSDSKPRNKTEHPAGAIGTFRESLDSAADVLGIGIIFPGSRDESGHIYSVDLSRVMLGVSEVEDADMYADSE